MVFEDLLRPLCLCTCSSCVEEVAGVHGSVKIASGMMNCKGKEGGRERGREGERETGGSSDGGRKGNNFRWTRQ